MKYKFISSGQIPAEVIQSEGETLLYLGRCPTIITTVSFKIGRRARMERDH
jgi:hypothetical protein